MKNKIFNKKIGIVLLVLMMLAAPQFSTAQVGAVTGILKAATCVTSPLKCASDFFEWVTQTLGYMAAAITAKLISFAAYFIQVMIKLSPEIIKSTVVQEGFKITLSFANLGFVLAVIFIAFVTIFRLQGYETKKLIRNLIVAAVLVNFSFTFAGLIMDAANVFGNFFTNAIVGDGGAENITKSIANALNIHKLNGYAPEPGALGTSLALGTLYYKTIFSLAFIILFNSVMVITFFVIAGLMVVRYVAISILLIVMPFAWLCWIFPSLSRHWSTWWSNFLKWNIFLPVLMFFIYIAVYTAAKVGGEVTKYSAGLTSQQAAGDLTTFAAGGITDIAQGLVMVGLLFGGMIIAQKMGVAGSGAIMNGANRVKGWVTGATVGMASGKYAYQAGRYAAGKVAPGFTPVKDGAQSLANILNKPALRWIPGADNAVGYLNKVASRKGEIENYQKNVASQLTDQQLEERLKGGVDRDPVRMGGLLAEAVKRKKVSAIIEGLNEKDAEDKMKLIASAVDKTNPGLKKEIANIKPSLAPALLSKPGKLVTVEDHMNTMTPAQILELKSEELTKAEVAAFVKQAGLAEIANKGTQEQLDAVRNGCVALVGTGEIGKAIKEASEKIEKAAGEFATAQKIRKTAITQEEKRKSNELVTKLQELIEEAKATRKKALLSATTLQQKAFVQLQRLDQIVSAKETGEDSKYTGNPFKESSTGKTTPTENQKTS